MRSDGGLSKMTRFQKGCGPMTPRLVRYSEAMISCRNIGITVIEDRDRVDNCKSQLAYVDSFYGVLTGSV
jgi:hypothetical protein